MEGTILRLAILCLVATVFCTGSAAANTVVQGLGVGFPYQINSLGFMLLIMSSLMMRP